MTWGRRQTLGASVFSSAKWKRNSPSHPYPPWAVVRRYDSITRVKSDSEHYTVNISKYLLQHRSLLWEPRVVQQGRVFGEPLCGPKQGLARMKPQQTPWPEVRWGWHSSPARPPHGFMCVCGGGPHMSPRAYSWSKPPFVSFSNLPREIKGSDGPVSTHSPGITQTISPALSDNGP